MQRWGFIIITGFVFRCICFEVSSVLLSSNIDAFDGEKSYAELNIHELFVNVHQNSTTAVMNKCKKEHNNVYKVKNDNRTDAPFYNNDSTIFTVHKTDKSCK